MNETVLFLSEDQLLELKKRKDVSRNAIHEEAMRLAAHYRRCESDLFRIIAEIEEKQIYMDMLIPSLFQYCVEMLRLSRQVSYDFICVVRKSKEVPKLREAILNQRTTLSKLRKICSVITLENADIWIGLTMNCSSRVVEKCVAQVNPRAAIMEKMKYVSGDTLQFQLAVSEEWSELLTSVKDLMSQKYMRAVSSEESLFLLMSEYKQKHDPVFKAERAEIRAKKKALQQEAFALSAADSGSGAGSGAGAGASLDSKPKSNSGLDLDKERKAGLNSTTANSRSRYIPAVERHTLNRRDGNQCAFVDRHGKRCTQKRWLQKHHIVHYAEGGDNNAENLQKLCWGHHCMMHRH